MLTLLIVIFGSHMWVQELCRDIYDDNQKLLPMVVLYLKYWQVCWILCWQRMKYSFVSKAEVYNTRRGKGSSKFQKSFAVIKNQEIYFNSTFFLLEQFSLNYSKFLLENQIQTDVCIYYALFARNEIIQKPSTPGIGKGVNTLSLVLKTLPIFSKSTYPYLLTQSQCNYLL